MSKRKAPTKTPRSTKVEIAKASTPKKTTKKETTKKPKIETPTKRTTKKTQVPAKMETRKTTKKEVPKKVTPKKATTKKETIKKAAEAAIIKEIAKKATAKKETAKKATTKKETAKKEAVKKEEVKKETAKKATTKKATTKKETTKKVTTKKETPKKEAVKKATTKKATTKKATATTKKAPATTTTEASESTAEKETPKKAKQPRTTKAEKPAPAEATVVIKRPRKSIPHYKRAKPNFEGVWPEASELTRGILLSFGSGDMAQLGLGLSEGMRERKFPTVLKTLQDVVAVSSGALHNAAITSAGLVYTWGCNDDAALGREGDEWLPHPVELEKAVKVCCGSSHTLALTSEGNVYAWGTYRNAQGVMGVIGNPLWGTRKLKEGEDEEPRVSHPTLQDLSEVVDIACGDSINLALTKGGDVFMWGDTGNDRRISGRLSGQRMTPHRVLFRGHGDVHPAQIKRIYAGGYSSFAVDAAGVVWGWGPNNYCQIGVDSDGDSLWVHTPKPLSTLTSPVVHLAAALHHTICVDEKGQVFTFGRGSSGRLGHGDENDRKVPTLVAALNGRGEDKVIRVACGEAHSCCVTAKGELFAFGNGDLNQLGNGVEGDVLLPYHVQGQQLVAAKRQVLAAGCGSQHTVIFTTVGDAIQKAPATPAAAAALKPLTIHAPPSPSATPLSAPSTAPLSTPFVAPLAAPSTAPSATTTTENAMEVDTPRGDAASLPAWPQATTVATPVDLGEDVALPDDDEELPEPSADDIAAIS